MVDQQKEHPEKSGSEPVFVLIEFCFKHALKILLLKESLYVKTFLLKWLNSSIINLIIFIASERHLVAVLQQVTKKKSFVCLGCVSFGKKN